MTGIVGNYPLIAILAASGIFVFGVMLFGSTVWRLNPASLGLVVCATLWVAGMGGTRIVGNPLFQYASFLIQQTALGALVPFLASTSFRFVGPPSTRSKAVFLGMSALSAGFIILIYTSPMTGLVFSDIARDPSGQLQRSTGPLFPFYVFYLLAAAIGSMYVVLSRVRLMSRMEARRAQVLVGAVSLPAFIAAIEAFGFRPLGIFSMVPFAMGASALILVWGIFNARLLSPVPMAHEALIKAMVDPVIVTDSHARVLYANDSAKALIGVTEFRLGTRLSVWLPELGELNRQVFLENEIMVHVGESNYLAHMSLIEEQSLVPTGSTALFSSRGVVLFVLRDVTSMATEQSRLESLVHERTIQLEEEIDRYREVKKELERSVEEKEILLQELHHRVKNNLQIISSLLYLQEMSVESSSAHATLQNARNQVLSMALVHEELYQSGDFSEIDFDSYSRRLVGRLLSAHRRENQILFVPTIESVKLGVNQAIPCGLILNELCTNVLRHAFPADKKYERCELHVGLSRKEGNQVVLLVADTGIGISQDVDLGTAGTLGMQIVSKLVKQLRGSLCITRGNPGTQFEIVFPMQADPGVKTERSSQIG